MDKPDLLKDQFARISTSLQEHWSVKGALAMVRLMSQSVQLLREEGLDISMETRPGSVTNPPFARGTITLDGHPLTFTVGYAERGGGLGLDLRNGNDALGVISCDCEREVNAGVFQSSLRTYLLQFKAATELYAQHDVGTGKTALAKPRAGGSLKP